MGFYYFWTRKGADYFMHLQGAILCDSIFSSLTGFNPEDWSPILIDGELARKAIPQDETCELLWELKSVNDYFPSRVRTPILTNTNIDYQIVTELSDKKVTKTGKRHSTGYISGLTTRRMLSHSRLKKL